MVRNLFRIPSAGPAVALLILLLTGAPSVQGSIHVLYPLTTDFNPTVTGPGITSTLDFSNLNLNTRIDDDGFGKVFQAYPTDGSTSAATALANNSFFSLNVTINPGTFGPTGLFFDVGKGGSTDPRGYFIRSSLDGYATDLLSQVLPGGVIQPPAPQSLELDWAGQTSVTLRFYVWTDNPYYYSVDFANVQVNQTPEPGALALVGLGIFAVAALRRKLARKS